MTILLICWGVLALSVALFAFFDDLHFHRPITLKSLLKMLWFGVWFPFFYAYYEYLSYQFNKRHKKRMEIIRGDGK